MEELNRSLGTPVVETAAGGSGGGGAVLTQADKAIIERYRAIALDTALTARKHPHALNRTCLNQWLLPLEGHRAMKLVARNQIAGTIKTVKPGATTKHVTIEVSPTVTITSSVTNEAAEEVGPKPGMKAIPVIKAIAVIKASDVMVGVCSAGGILTAGHFRQAQSRCQLDLLLASLASSPDERRNIRGRRRFAPW